MTQTSRLVSQAGRKSQLLVEDQAMSKAISGLSGPRSGKKFKKSQRPLSPRITRCARVSVCMRVRVRILSKTLFFCLCKKKKNKFKKR